MKKSKTLDALIVEDRTEWADVVIRCANSLDFAPQSVNNAPAAKSALETNAAIKVVFLDLDLRYGPSIGTRTAKDVVETIKERADVVLVVVTGISTNAEFNRFLADELKIQPTDFLSRFMVRPELFVKKEDLLWKAAEAEGKLLLDVKGSEKSESEFVQSHTDVLAQLLAKQIEAALRQELAEECDPEGTPALPPFQYAEENDRLRGSNRLFTRKVRLCFRPVLRALTGIGSKWRDENTPGVISKPELAAAYAAGLLREARVTILKRLAMICRGKGYEEDCRRVIARLEGASPWEHEDAAVLRPLLDKHDIVDKRLNECIERADRLRKPAAVAVQLCKQFSTEFHKWQRAALNIPDKDALVRAVSGEGYELGELFDRAWPVFKGSHPERTVSYDDNRLPGRKGKKSGAVEAPLEDADEEPVAEAEEGLGEPSDNDERSEH